MDEQAQQDDEEWSETPAGRLWMLVQDRLLTDDMKAPFAEVHESDDGLTLVFCWRDAVPEPLPKPLATLLDEHAHIALTEHEVAPAG